MSDAILKLCTEMPTPIDPDSTLEAAMDTDRRWPLGATLRVYFSEGDQAVHARVAEIAAEWSRYANLSFEFVKEPPAEIRVSFDPRLGSWSYIGTDCIHLRLQGRPTMNLGWLKASTTVREYRRVVLHEFGHAIGLIHEHLSPAAEIPWNEQAVIRYYQRTNGWDEAYIRNNVLTHMKADEFTRFDPRSIMLYPVPKELTLGGYSIPWTNDELSELDKQFVAEMYPFPKT